MHVNTMMKVDKISANEDINLHNDKISIFEVNYNT